MSAFLVRLWLGSCSPCRPLSSVWLFDPFRALPFWARGVVGLVFLPAYLLVLLCLCCAPFCGWLGPVVSVLFFGCCRLPSLPDVASLPPAVGPVWRPGPVCTLVPPSGCICDGLVALLYCWECGCALSSLHHFVSWQQRLLALCRVCITLSTMLHVLLGCSVLPRWGIHQDDDPGSPLVSAKLHYCYSNAVSAAFSAPVLLCHSGTPPFLCCLPGLVGFCSCCGFVAFCWFCCVLRCLW